MLPYAQPSTQGVSAAATWARVVGVLLATAGPLLLGLYLLIGSSRGFGELAALLLFLILSLPLAAGSVALICLGVLVRRLS